MNNTDYATLWEFCDGATTWGEGQAEFESFKNEVNSDIKAYAQPSGFLYPQLKNYAKTILGSVFKSKIRSMEATAA
ncbi:hypothetical protein [Adhaeribacter aquaticus]|uniref:hypothetical protein n=1 Tax=Adhaeribacter aquaticus TaxID=299567 RepID=UPI0004132DF9|nr:hypothetical protein [Adhaeribacter aquaticus]